VVSLVDLTAAQSADKVAASYDYTPYGLPTVADGPAAAVCPFRFSTKYYDAEIGLYYYGCRYYDPASGTWLNRDPLGEEGGLNLYAFCGGDPVNTVDLYGLWSWGRSTVYELLDDAWARHNSLTAKIAQARQLIAAGAGPEAVAAALKDVDEAYGNFHRAQLAAKQAHTAYEEGLWWVGPFDMDLQTEVMKLPDTSLGVYELGLARAEYQAANSRMTYQAWEGEEAAWKRTMALVARGAGISQGALALAQAEAGTACFLAPEPTAATKAAGGFLWYRALDNGVCAGKMIWTGEFHTTYSHRAVKWVARQAGASPQVAGFIGTAGDVIMDCSSFYAADKAMAGAAARAAVNEASEPVSALAVPTGQRYSVAFDTELKATSYPGVSRGLHFREANEALLQAMEGDARLAQMMRSLGVNLKRTATGAAPRTPPSGWSWHHSVQPGVMQLVPRAQHTSGSIFWDTFHPGGHGGYAIWGEP